MTHIAFVDRDLSHGASHTGLQAMRAMAPAVQPSLRRPGPAHACPSPGGATFVRGRPDLVNAIALVGAHGFR